MNAALQKAQLQRDSARIFEEFKIPITLPNHVAIGLTMRNERIRFKVSLREVARRMKLSAPYVSDLELGRRHWTQARVFEAMTAVHGA